MRLTVDEAFERFGDRLYAAAFSVCRSKADAEDAVQEAFIKYYSLNSEYDSEEHIKAWLIRVCVNRAKDLSSSFWRKNKVTWEDYMDDMVFEQPEDERLFEEVMRLPEKYRIVIHLFYYEDYSVAEIAKILSSTEGTVKSQLSRGRSLLKTKLAEEWNND